MKSITLAPRQPTGRGEVVDSTIAATASGPSQLSSRQKVKRRIVLSFFEAPGRVFTYFSDDSTT